MSYEDLFGWFDYPELYDEAIKTAPKNAILVECGTAFGRSISYLARKAIDAKRHDLQIYCVDPWRDDQWEDGIPRDYTVAPNERPSWGAGYANYARGLGGPFNAFLAGMQKFCPEELERICPLKLTGDKAARLFKDDPSATVWLVFLDGDHRYEAVKTDINAWKDIVPPEGLFCGHDYTLCYPGVVMAVQELLPGKFGQVGESSWMRVRPSDIDNNRLKTTTKPNT